MTVDEPTHYARIYLLDRQAFTGWGYGMVLCVFVCTRFEIRKHQPRYTKLLRANGC